MKKIQKALAIVFVLVFALTVVSPAFASGDYTENAKFVKLTAAEIDAKYNNGNSFIVMLYEEGCFNCNYLGNNVVAKWMDDYDRTIYALDLQNTEAFPAFVIQEYGNSFTTPVIAFVANRSHESFSGYEGETTVSALNNKFYRFYGITPEKKISSIAIAATPIKTVYTVGDTFSSEGLALKINYSDGTTETVTTGFTCSSPNMKQVGTKFVAVTYEGKTVSFSIEVNAEEVTTRPAEPTTRPVESTTRPAEPTTTPAEPTTTPEGSTSIPQDVPTTKPSDSNSTEEIIIPPSVYTVSYGDSLVLHVDKSKIPQGGSVVWTADNNNFSCTQQDDTTYLITPKSSGETTFTATVYDAERNAVSTDEQTITSKAGFFRKIIAFFKQLFNLTKVYDKNLPA